MNRDLKYFLKGMGSVLDIFGQRYPHSGIKNDEEALRSDWEAIGKDMKTVIRRFDKELNENDK